MATILVGTTHFIPNNDYWVITDKKEVKKLRIYQLNSSKEHVKLIAGEIINGKEQATGFYFLHDGTDLYISKLAAENIFFETILKTINRYE